ncbi:hypothetical protein [Herpetosiphon sp. NSE202]|uniref:hypothetical protein n=1 Tax=Herpetosiphon sp. NSE202 TaxID=3351349 RepID=UPI003643E3EE
MEKMVTMLHVQAAHGQAEATQRGVIELLRKHVIAEGFVEAAPEATTADRVIRVAAPLASGWIPLDGSLTRSFDVAELQACGQTISLTLMTNVVITRVFEYDSLELWLYRDGKLIDHYASDPSSVSLPLPRRRWKEVKGNVEAWADVLPPTADRSALKKLFRTRPIASDDAFAIVAAQLGLNPDHWCGLSDDEPIIRLKFRSTQLPHPQTPLHGEPRFLWGSHPAGIESIVGQPFDFTWMVHPVGGPSSGLVINFQGTALEQGLLQFESLSTHINHDQLRFEHNMAIESDALGSIHVDFPDHPVPAGQVGAIMPLEAWNWRETVKARWQDVIVMKLTGRVRSAGTGNLKIRTYPKAGSPATGTTLDLSCTLHPMPLISPRIQDLVAKTSKDTLTKYIFDLYTPRILQAHLVFDPTPDVNAAFLAAFEQWHGLLEPFYPHGYYSLITAAERYPFLRRTRLRSQTIPTGKRWTQLQKRLQSTTMILLERETPLSIQDTTRSNRRLGEGMIGGTLERDSVFLHESNEVITPQMSLWVDLYTIPQEHHAELVAQLTEIVETLFTSQQGIQAYLAKWDTIPDGLDSTAYELIGDVDGQITMSQSWCSQFLRAVTERMWLGPALLSRIENPEALAEHGIIQQLSNGIRIDVESIPQLHALETMLTPLIPTKEDWDRAHDALYDYLRSIKNIEG